MSSIDEFLNSIKSNIKDDEVDLKKKSRSLALNRLKENQSKQENSRRLKPGPRVVHPRKSTSFSLELAIVAALEQYVIENAVSKSLVVKKALQKYLEEDLKVEINWDLYRER